STLTYDVANRLATATAIGGGMETYQYAPDNKMVMRTLPSQQQEFTFYGGQGEKLGVFWLSWPDAYHPNFTFVPKGVAVWFAGRKVVDYGSGSAPVPMTQDRLGSNRNGGARYRPYGDEITSTANDQVKFATYTRDAYTGLDYADQRFYASGYGRFNTPDPNHAGASPKAPITWNMYAYGAGDPTNNYDPSGLASCGLLSGDDDDRPEKAGIGCSSGGGHFSSGPTFPEWADAGPCKGTGTIDGFNPVGSPWCYG